MKRQSNGALLTVALLGGVIAALAMPDVDDSSRYKTIVERNVFNLKAPTPPGPPPEPPPPSTTVKLTGITTVLSAKRALLLITEQGKPAEAKIIKEGEREGMVEVLQIDEDAGTVRIKNGDQEVTLNFQEHGVKPPTGPATPPPGTPSITSPTNRTVVIGGQAITIGSPSAVRNPRLPIPTTPGAYAGALSNRLPATVPTPTRILRK